MINFTPIPTLDLGFIKISTHGLLIAVGFLAGELLARREAKRRGLSADIVDNAAIIAVLAGLIGARIVYIVFFGQGMGLVEALQIWHGGLSSHGGYIFGILAGFMYFKIKKVDILKYADAVLPYLLIGWAIGRLGCFLNWDSYGRIADSAWAVAVNNEARYPTQLFEAFGSLLAFFLLRKTPRSWIFAERRAGGEAAISLALFALVRFVVDFWRGDPPQYMLLSRVVTLSIIAGVAAFVAWTSRKRPDVV